MSDTATPRKAINGIKLVLLALLIGSVAVALSYIIANGGVPIAGILIILPVAIAFAGLCIVKPKQGLFLYLHLSFITNGLMRFLAPDVPYGLIIDGVLVMCLLGTFFNVRKKDLERLNNPMLWLVLIWFLYTVFEVINPEARSKEAWFYAVRGVSIYWMFSIVPMFIFLRDRADLNRFIRVWMGWSFAAAIWGFKQQYIGITAGEQAWLDSGPFITHVLMGNLRSFSFYSDAGQFGAAMAHASLFAGIAALGEQKLRIRILYGILAITFFWGFAVAGSRGPLFIIAGGFFMYLFMIKNFRILSLGLALGACAFVFLKFTTIAQGNYQVQRLRSALDPNDESLQVRLENQRKLAQYLSSRPLGGGIGSGGNWGQRFTPGTFLAETALDSWYVKIWVETGIIGLCMHIAQILLILFFGFKKVFYLHDPQLRLQCIGLLCGFFGVALASYGNQIFGQTPTGTVLYFSMVFFYICDKMDTVPPEELENQPQKEKNLLW